MHAAVARKINQKLPCRSYSLRAPEKVLCRALQALFYAAHQARSSIGSALQHAAGLMGEHQSLTGNARPPMTRQPSRAVTAALACTAEQIEQAKVELQRRRSSLVVTTQLADIVSGELNDAARNGPAGDGPAAAGVITRRDSQLAREPSSQLVTALHEILGSQLEIASGRSNLASRRVSIQLRQDLMASDAEVCTPTTSQPHCHYLTTSLPHSLTASLPTTSLPHYLTTSQPHYLLPHFLAAALKIDPPKHIQYPPAPR